MRVREDNALTDAVKRALAAAVAADAEAVFIHTTPGESSYGRVHTIEGQHPGQSYDLVSQALPLLGGPTCPHCHR